MWTIEIGNDTRLKWRFSAISLRISKALRPCCRCQSQKSAPPVRHARLLTTFVIDATTYVVGESEQGREQAVSEKISEAELVVMEALWEQAPATANDVADRVTAERDWSLQTVKTLLSRLMAKEVIAADQDGRRFLYRPLVAREDYVASESGRLVNRLFGGRISPLVAQLASQDQLSADDIAELEEILKGLKS